MQPTCILSNVTKTMFMHRHLATNARPDIENIQPVDKPEVMSASNLAFSTGLTKTEKKLQMVNVEIM
jgi:hypothetical protein